MRLFDDGLIQNKNIIQWALASDKLSFIYLYMMLFSDLHKRNALLLTLYIL